jgi:hypothetical protein
MQANCLCSAIPEEQKQEPSSMSRWSAAAAMLHPEANIDMRFYSSMRSPCSIAIRSAYKPPPVDRGIGKRIVPAAAREA